MKTEYEEVTKLKVSKGVHVRQDVRPHGPPREQVGRPLINGVTGSDRAMGRKKLPFCQSRVTEAGDGRPRGPFCQPPADRRGQHRQNRGHGRTG